MKSFEQLCENVKGTALKTGDKAEELFCQGKTQLQILKIRRELRRCYTCLGLRVYSKAKAGEDYSKTVLSKVEEINLLRRQLLSLKDHADLIRYCKRCKNCGFYNDREDELCLNCGAALHPYQKKGYTVLFGEQELEQQAQETDQTSGEACED